MNYSIYGCVKKQTKKTTGSTGSRAMGIQFLPIYKDDTRDKESPSNGEEVGEWHVVRKLL